MGLTRPYDTTWGDGREVTAFPNGDVVERTTGYFVRKGNTLNNFKEPQQVMQVQQEKQTTKTIPNDLLIFGLLIIGIIAITGVVTNSKRWTCKILVRKNI